MAPVQASFHCRIAKSGSEFAQPLQIVRDSANIPAQTLPLRWLPRLNYLSGQETALPLCEHERGIRFGLLVRLANRHRRERASRLPRGQQRAFEGWGCIFSKSLLVVEALSWAC